MVGNNRSKAASEFSQSFATGLKNRCTDDLMDMNVCASRTLEKESAALQSASVNSLFGTDEITTDDDTAFHCKKVDISGGSMGNAKVGSCLTNCTAANDHDAPMVAAKESALAILLPEDSEASYGSEQMSLPQTHTRNWDSCSTSLSDGDRNSCSNDSKHDIALEEEDQTHRVGAGGENIYSTHDAGDHDNCKSEKLVKEHVPNHLHDMNSTVKRIHGLE
jgi:hypothetical protein